MMNTNFYKIGNTETLPFNLVGKKTNVVNFVTWLGSVQSLQESLLFQSKRYTEKTQAMFEETL